MAGQIALNKPSGGQLILSPEDGTSTETVTIPSVGVGKVLQVVQAIAPNQGVTTTSTSYTATGISAQITPTRTDSKILISVSGGHPYTSNGSGIIISIFKDGVDLCGRTYGFQQNYNSAAVVHTAPYSINILNTANTTSTITYEVYFRSRSGQMVSAQEAGDAPSITLMEVAA